MLLTLQDIFKAKNKVINSDTFLSSTLEQISKQFIGEITGENLFRMQFNEIRNCYLKTFTSKDQNEIPIDESTFHSFVCNKHLKLARDPRTDFAIEYRKIMQDLDSIDSNRTKLKKKLKELDSGPLSDETTYKKRLVEYYINKNTKAENEIIDFLRHEIKEWILYNISTPQGRSWLSFQSANLLLKPYHFRRNPSFYEIEQFSEIANKYGNITIIDYQKLEGFYFNDKQQYLIEAEKLLPHNTIKGMIAGRINSNHHMYDRRSIVNAALDSFEDNKELFCNLIPQQIEGILYDYATELGIEEKALTNSTIVEKIQFIISRIPFFFEDEYYLFHFPIIRNRIAHGKLLTADLDLLSYHLLLDLNHVSSFLEDNNILLNRAIECIKKIENEPDLFELLSFAIYYNVNIPKFYGIEAKVTDLKQKCIHELTWDGKLADIALQNSDDINAGLLNIASNLRKQFNENIFTTVLKEVKSNSQYDEKAFLTALTNMKTIRKMARKESIEGQTSANIYRRLKVNKKIHI